MVVVELAVAAPGRPASPAPSAASASSGVTIRSLFSSAAERRLGDHPVERLLADLAAQPGGRLLTGRQVAGLLRHRALVLGLEGGDFDRLAGDLGDPAWAVPSG